MRETEHQLLEAVGSGDRQAMRRLYDRYAGYAMATGLRYIGESEAVRDVVQESFIKVFTTIGRFRYRGEGSLKAWINRIVANQAIDYLQERHRVTFVSTLPLEAEDEEPNVEHIPHDVLMRLIGQLPTGYRMVLNLYVFEQLSHRDIARRLGIREATSASQYNRAKACLARLLKNYLKEQEET